MKDIKTNKDIKNYTSQKYLIVAFCLFFIIVPYLISWFLIGEFNFLKLNWFHHLENNVYVFNLNILYTILGIIGLSIIFFIIFLFLFKILKLDSIPFIIMSHVIGISAIVTGLIPYTNKTFSYIIIARFLIVIFLALIFFFLFNFISNKILLSTNINYQIYKDYVKDEKEKQKMNKDMNDLIEKHKEKDYIEIEKE